MISISTIDDVSNLLYLVNKAYRGEDAKKGWTHEADIVEGNLRIDSIGLQKLIQDPQSVILKYMQEEVIIGCVHLEKRIDKIYLGLLSVFPDMQGAGIGKKLLKVSEDFASENNCHVIEISVISVRKDIIAWYERQGYKKTGEVKPFTVPEKFGKPKQPIEFIVMKKTLS